MLIIYFDHSVLSEFPDRLPERVSFGRAQPVNETVDFSRGFAETDAGTAEFDVLWTGQGYDLLVADVVS